MSGGREGKKAPPLGKLAAGDRIERRVRRRDGQDQTLALPPGAASAVEALIMHLVSGERVAVLAEDQELSPTEASAILGVSRALVVLRWIAAICSFAMSASTAAGCSRMCWS